MDKIFSKILCGYFCSTRFNEMIVDFVPKLIPLTRTLWQQTKIKMLPTPAKFHYVFNLRDLSRIYEGILTVKGPECTSIQDVLKLWRHECFRVIADRFTNSEDKKWFNMKMGETANQLLGEYFEHYTEEETYYADFLREAAEPTGDEDEDVSVEAPKVYEEMSSLEFVKNKVTSFMEQFNENIRGIQLDLVLFHDCLVHLIIISRIVRTPRGNALLVGVGGSGKQSLTRLASYIAGYKFYQITLTRSYNTGNFLDDLKYLYRTAGLEGNGITFIFTDNDIKDEAFLEYLNNVLSSGEVANLFAKDEIDEMCSELEPIMKKNLPKSILTRDKLYDYFIMRARANLHIALCFSPIGEKFRNRALKFPGLISGCTMDWFQKWPEDARIGVSRQYLQNCSIVCSPTVKAQVINMMSFIHNHVSEACTIYYDRFRRQTFVTPRSLISFLESYRILYTEKYDNIQLLAGRMQTGLTKLVEAASAVEILKTELIEKVCLNFY